MSNDNDIACPSCGAVEIPCRCMVPPGKLPLTPVGQTLRNQTKHENVPGIKALETLAMIVFQNSNWDIPMTPSDFHRFLMETIEKLRSERHGNV